MALNLIEARGRAHHAPRPRPITAALYWAPGGRCGVAPRDCRWPLAASALDCCWRWLPAITCRPGYDCDGYGFAKGGLGGLHRQIARCKTDDYSPPGRLSRVINPLRCTRVLLALSRRGTQHEQTDFVHSFGFSDLQTLSVCASVFHRRPTVAISRKLDTT